MHLPSQCTYRFKIYIIAYEIYGLLRAPRMEETQVFILMR